MAEEYDNIELRIVLSAPKMDGGIAPSLVFVKGKFTRENGDVIWKESQPIQPSADISQKEKGIDLYNRIAGFDITQIAELVRLHIKQNTDSNIDIKEE